MLPITLRPALPKIAKPKWWQEFHVSELRALAINRGLIGEMEAERWGEQEKEALGMLLDAQRNREGR
jgi:hypothetical protein